MWWKWYYHYFWLWSKWGYRAKIHDTVRDLARTALGKKAPTAAIIDSQSVRTASQPGPRGYDAARKINGRKRHVLVDTCGFLLALKVTPADVQDRDGARVLLTILMLAFGWLKIIQADSAYGGPLQDEVRSIPRHRKVKLEIVKRSDDVKGFKVLPKGWIACGCLRYAPAVERTFGWLIQSRRLVRDYEAKISHSESMIHLSITKRMLARIHQLVIFKTASEQWPAPSEQG